MLVFPFEKCTGLLIRLGLKLAQLECLQTRRDPRFVLIHRSSSALFGSGLFLPPECIFLLFCVSGKSHRGSSESLGRDLRVQYHRDAAWVWVLFCLFSLSKCLCFPPVNDHCHSDTSHKMPTHGRGAQTQHGQQALFVIF